MVYGVVATGQQYTYGYGLPYNTHKQYINGGVYGRIITNINSSYIYTIHINYYRIK